MSLVLQFATDAPPRLGADVFLAVRAADDSTMTCPANLRLVVARCADGSFVRFDRAPDQETS